MGVGDSQYGCFADFAAVLSTEVLSHVRWGSGWIWGD